MDIHFLYNIARRTVLCMLTFLELIKTAVNDGADEIFLVAGQPVMLRTGAVYRRLDDVILMPDDTARFVRQAYEIAKRQVALLDKNRDDQFALSLTGISRIRVTSFFQRNSYAMAARVIPFGIPRPEDIHIPESVMALSELTEGLVLFCGPSGCGKSTSATCLINTINEKRSCQILTLENPIEYLFRNQQAFVSQRELLLDTVSFASGMLSSRWLSPDVLFIGDLNVGTELSEVLEKADNSCLVVGTLLARSPAAAILTMLHRFGGEERRQMAMLLSQVLRAVVFQKLVPEAEGRMPVFELIEPDAGLRRAIQSGSMEDIYSALEN